MKGFMHIDLLQIPYSCIESVYKHLRAAGMKGVEGVALWAGNSAGSAFSVQSTIIPKQTAYKREAGLLYTVDGDELHRINVWLYEHKFTLIAQLHSHPSEAYHSDTDDLFPIVTQVGCVSIVIPNFAFDAFSLSKWAVYRLIPGNGWTEVLKKEVESLIEITDK